MKLSRHAWVALRAMIVFTVVHLRRHIAQEPSSLSGPAAEYRKAGATQA